MRRSRYESGCWGWTRIAIRSTPCELVSERACEVLSGYSGLPLSSPSCPTVVKGMINLNRCEGVVSILPGQVRESVAVPSWDILTLCHVLMSFCILLSRW